MKSLYILLIAVLIALTFAAPVKKVTKKPSWCTRYVNTMRVPKRLTVSQKKVAVKRCNKLIKKAKTAKKFRVVKRQTKKFLKRYHVRKPSTKRLRRVVRKLYKKAGKKSSKRSTRRYRRNNRRHNRRYNRTRRFRRNYRRVQRKPKKVVKKFKACKGRNMRRCLQKRAKKQQKKIRKQKKVNRSAYLKRQKMIKRLRQIRKVNLKKLKKMPKKVIKIVRKIQKPVTKKITPKPAPKPTPKGKPAPKIIPKPAPVRCPKTAIVRTVATESYKLRSCLEENESLKVGEGLVSNNGRYHLVYQRDGNVVIYRDNNKAVWASNTWRQASTQIAMQADGHFVLYNNKKAMWWTGYWVPDTGRQVHKYMIRLNDEGFLDTYDGRNAKVHVFKYVAPK